MIKRIQSLSWPIVLILCATLGLAPFSPEPHIVEKLRLLFTGNLTATIDVFDLVMHGSPFILVFVKIAFPSKIK